MGLAKISDGTNTYTGYADERAVPIYNANTVITVGGVVKKQTDVTMLEITVRYWVKAEDIASFNNVVENFTDEITYTTGTRVWDKAAGSEIQVVIEGSPEVELIGWNGQQIYQVTLTLQEVISS
jgi:hypothetical protein